MCGINLIYAFGPDAGPADREELRRTRDAMRTRGPDAAGEWFSGDGRVAMGHRRLSIIDVSHRADQPMTAGGRYTVIFNGEIYNHRQLREELERDGVTFSTSSDTEVLLALFAREGAAMVSRLRGMFAFCIWDAARRSLFIARDPYGIKPLYYATDGKVFRLASQVKAILAGGGVSREADPAGVTGLLIRGTVPEPFTTHAAIRAVPAGSLMHVDSRGEIRLERYFSLADVMRESAEQAHSIPAAEHAAIVRDAVSDSVKAHLVSDVPVGVFLSAGKDSAAIAALAAQHGGRDLVALTLRCAEFAGTPQDEAPEAAQVARRYGLRHVIRTLDKEEFLRDLPRVLASMDQPSIDGWNSYFVSKAAAELGLKVMLSGTGGDELFGGYSSFRKIPSFVKINRPLSRIPGWGEGFRKLWLAFAESGPHRSPKTANMYRYCRSYETAYLMKRGLFLPEEIADVISPELAEEGLKRLGLERLILEAITPDPGTPFGRVSALESSFFLRDQLLRDIDWASMAHSVEVRVPLVDAALLARVAPVAVSARDYRKTLLARAPELPLPSEIVNRKKTGFLLPIRQWLRPPGVHLHEFGMRAFALQMVEGLLA
jgi:asparagine synthase (glutamine-hydrolysing)